MRRFLYDTNVFVYALGAAHWYREPCRAIVARQGEGALGGETTAVVVAELAHQRLRQSGDRAEAARRAREVTLICRTHEVAERDVELALDLYERSAALDAFDALLAAVALNRGIEAIVSADQGFDELADLERVDPLDAETVDALAHA